jgi:hypothetical protein
VCVLCIKLRGSESAIGKSVFHVCCAYSSAAAVITYVFMCEVRVCSKCQCYKIVLMML